MSIGEAAENNIRGDIVYWSSCWKENVFQSVFFFFCFHSLVVLYWMAAVQRGGEKDERGELIYITFFIYFFALATDVMWGDRFSQGEPRTASELLPPVSAEPVRSSAASKPQWDAVCSWECALCRDDVQSN